MRCIQCHKPGDLIKIPEVTRLGQEPLGIHKDCLRANLFKAASDPKKRELLKAMVEWHEKPSSGKLPFGFEARDVGATAQELTPLVKLGILGRSYHSRRYTHYLLTSVELTKQVLAEVEGKPVKEAIAEGEIPKEIFDVIVGYDDLKENLIFALERKRKVSFLLCGPPATAKSLIILCVQKAVGDRAYLATGSRTTAVGLTEVLLDYRPEVLLLDELDKMDMKCYAVLLSLMETGDVLVTKHGSHGGIKLDTIVIGACNRTDRLPPELVSRFMVINFKPYDRETFVEVCRRWLSRDEEIPEDLASYIGERVWEELERDVRRARDIARLLREKTKEDVDRVVKFLKRYGQ